MKESPSNYNRIGMTLGQRGRFAQAVEAFERAIEIKPDFAPAYHNLGLSYWNLGRPDAAIRAYRKAIAIDPTNVEPYCGAVQVLWARRQDAEAVETMRDAVRHAPRSHKSHHTLGLALERVFEWEAAAESYRAAAESHPGVVDPLLSLANVCLYALDRADEAFDALTRASEIDPDDERVRRALAESMEFFVR